MGDKKLVIRWANVKGKLFFSPSLCNILFSPGSFSLLAHLPESYLIFHSLVILFFVRLSNLFERGLKESFLFEDHMNQKRRMVVSCLMNSK